MGGKPVKAAPAGAAASDPWAEAIEAAVVEAAAYWGMPKVPPTRVGAAGRTAPAGYLGCGYDPMADRLVFARESLGRAAQARQAPTGALIRYAAFRAVGEAAEYRAFDAAGLAPFLPVVDRLLDKLWYRKYWTKLHETALVLSDIVVQYVVAKRLADGGHRAPLPLDGALAGLRKLKAANPGQFQFAVHRDLVDYLAGVRFATMQSGDREGARGQLEGLLRSSVGPKAIFAVERALAGIEHAKADQFRDGFPKVVAATFPEAVLEAETHPLAGLPVEEPLPSWWTAKSVQVFRWKSAVPEKIPQRPKF